MLYLSIDQGGSSSRALVSDQHGNIITRHQVKVATVRNGAFIEQSPDDLLSSIKSCINTCYARLSKSQKKVLVSASLVTQRSSFIAINKQNHQPLTQVISWQDTRGQQLLEELMIDNDWLNARTGLRASAHYGASKMLWCLQNNKKVQQAAQRNDLLFLPIASYLAKQLTMSAQSNTHYSVDPANASRTLLFDSLNLQWHEELLSLFTIKPAWLPKIRPTLSYYGDIQLTDQSIPLNYLNGDQSAALFAFGQPKANELYLNIGTGAFVSCLHSTHAIDDKNLLRSLVLTEQFDKSTKNNIQKTKNLYVQEGTVNGAGAALYFIMEQLKLTNFVFTEEMFNENELNIPLFINTIGGLAAPYWRTDIPAHFIHTDNQEALAASFKFAATNNKMIAVLESIAFLITVIIQRMTNKDTTRLINIQCIRISGGLANNAFLCQMIADLTQLTLIRADEVEASALGAVWCLAEHTEKIKPIKWLSHLDNVSFIAKEHQTLINRFEQWQNIMTKLTHSRLM